ncbi:MAG: hypothetical protein LC734_11050, partial [Acidobacteria bacterium]|nr:hypothetical protein [Acidobacteriota bacterium]
MNMKRIAKSILAAFLFSIAVSAQRAEISVSLNEAFFDTLLDAVFKHAPPPDFPISGGSSSSGACSETVRLRREVGGTRTAVRFRDGKIVAPIAFWGNYNPPLVGCVEFSGVAETILN